MTKKDSSNGTALAGSAAKAFTRRSLLRGATSLGLGAALAPLYVKRAFANSGELNILCWSAELPEEVMTAFTEATGITVNKTPFSSNEEAINKMQATFGEGFDLVMPSVNRASEFQYIEVLQPFDEARVNLDAYQPGLLKASSDSWSWDGLYHLPHMWGAEGLSWDNSVADLSYADASYGLVWSDEYSGRAQVRPTSALLGLGLFLDASGQLPSNRMMDAYKDPETMRKIYEEILAYAVARKGNIKQFWDSTDTIRAGFSENGCVIGQTWDGPVKQMAKQGQPMSFMAPQEGGLTWMDGFAMSAAARNVDEVYAFLGFTQNPEIAGRIAELASYNSPVKGAAEFTPEIDRELFDKAYPEDALDKLWWYPASPEWFNPIRNEYAEKFRVA
ncbi:extracellular solute-binding protein [Salipiger abyssi]|uniref:extracellular solute-binding protein n=1 Tax=Salipiger abyssi TaxID=1250539 RepID=UPI001A9034D7|nr:extracellular solute-binding protein [Salipiger abyssi]MBN9887903.1 extracellular solute-binding protein [Salipiger abyssi]